MSHCNRSKVSLESYGNGGYATDGIETYLGVIRGTRREEGLEGVVAGEKETGKVDEELASNVEEDQEEVDSDQAEDHVDLGDIGLTLKVVEDRVLGELSEKMSVSNESFIAEACCHDTGVNRCWQLLSPSAPHAGWVCTQCSAQMCRGLELRGNSETETPHTITAGTTHLLVKLGNSVLGTVLE